MDSLNGFTFAGLVGNKGLNISPLPPRQGRSRHSYGDGPFAKLVMPPLPLEPGIYAWRVDGRVTYLGQTRTTIAKRLGSMGYSTISNYNTFAREPGKRNGGQETNCRINALANEVLDRGEEIEIWYRITKAEESRQAESTWIERHGKPPWNR